MNERNVTDTAGRTWLCTPGASGAGAEEKMGRDVALACTTATVTAPVALSVGWQWEKMSDAGLARMILSKSPVPKR